MWGRSKYIDDQSDGIDIKHDLTDIADDYGPGDSFPYNINFLFYEQYAVFRWQILLFCLCLVCSAFFFTLVLSFDMVAALLVTINTIVILLSAWATMWVFSLSLNVVTIFWIFMVGILGFEFSSHITHVFIT